MKCEKCRTVVPDGANFCHECGASFMPEVVNKEDTENKATKDQIVLTIENGKLTPESEIVLGMLFHPDGEIVKTIDEISFRRIVRWVLELGCKLHYRWAMTLEEEYGKYSVYYKPQDEKGAEYESDVKLMLKAQKMVDETSEQEDQAASSASH